MANYLTRTRTLTLSENDYRALENIQEDMEEMTFRNLEDWLYYVEKGVLYFDIEGDPELVEDIYGNETIYKISLVPREEYSNEEDREEDEEYVEVDENEVAIYISKYRIFDFLDSLVGAMLRTTSDLANYFTEFKTIDFDDVAELMAANYCPWMEDVLVYIDRRGDTIRFTIDYLSVMETATEMDENYMQFYNDFESELNELLTIGVKAEKVSGLDDMLDDDSAEVEYIANKYE